MPPEQVEHEMLRLEDPL